MGKMKQLISVFLALVMTVGILPSVVASAAETEHPIETEQTEVIELPEQDLSAPVEEAETDVKADAQTDEVDGEQPDAVAAQEVGTGDFVVEGGTQGTDYSFANGVLTILTGTQLTIRNADPKTPTGHRILVPADVKAELVFDGVNIRTTNNSPFTLTPQVGGGAQAHIVLADGSENTLVSTASAYPGLRAGKTTTLMIDDSVVNKDSNGHMITPENGKIPADLTLSNGMNLQKGDRLTKLDSKNPGKLKVEGGSYAAGIGGGDTENGGHIIFNGGIIDADNKSSSYGTGIGGGGCAAGGDIVINGGKILAWGGYHGAGIGGGYFQSASSTLQPAVVDPNTGHGYSGNITINGGYSDSYGGNHGSAFGDGCINPTAPLGYKIIVTGGTILAHLTETNYWTSDLSAVGGDVFVTGGSLRADTFQSAGESVAYGDFDKKTKVFMTTISLEYLGLDKVGTALVDDFELLIGGKKTNYGAPSYTDENGILYLWLPSDSQGKEVTVNTAVKNKETGETITPDSFFITEVTPNSNLKQYCSFEIAENIVPHEQMTKRYDGLAFDNTVSKHFLDVLMKDGGIPVKNPENGKLTDIDVMSVSSRRLNDKLEPDTDYEGGDLSKQCDAGKYELVITSTQYSGTKPFSDAYWGHRAYYKYAEITKADTETRLTATKTKTTVVKPEDKVTFTAEVRPAQNEGAACAAPRGFAQFYVDGKEYGDPVKLTLHNDVAKDGHFYSTADIELTLKDIEGIVFNKDHKKVSVQYIGDDINYTKGTTAEVELELDLVDIDIDGDGNSDVNIDVDGDGKPDINIDTDGDLKPDVNIDTNKDGKPDINIDTDNSGEWKPSTEGGNADGIWKPDTSIDTNGDGIGDKDHKREPIDENKDGVDDNWKPNKDVTTGDVTYDTSDPSINIDTNGDGTPDINIDTNGDGKPDVNIDTDGDLKPDINIDTDKDNKPDINIDVDGDDKPDINIDTDGDSKPDVNIDINGDQKPDINIDTDNSGEWKPSNEGGNADGIWKPDTNIDTNGDGKGDKDHKREPIDNDKDGVDDNWKPNKDVTNDKDEVIYDTSDPSINIDTDGDGKPDVNIDTDKDGKPDINIDTDGDLKPDVNIDVDKDGKPDLNVDTDKDGKPDINIDIDGDKKPDINIDTDNSGEWKPSNEGGNADGIWKPDTSIDTDGDGKGDKDHKREPIDNDKDGVDDNWKPDKDVTNDKDEVIYETDDPSINIDVDGDGKPDINIDTDGDGKPDVNIDTDGDLKPDQNIDADGDGKPDINDGPWIPRPNKPENPVKDNGMLNKEDHFAYIIGYPVDYITGEPTSDQTRMPVRPQGKITRAEVATIYFRMLTDETRNLYWTQKNSFSDVSQDDWFNNAISTMSNAGIITGYPDGTFRPNAYITRAEFAAIAVRFFEVEYQGAKMFPDIEGHWASDYINKAASIKLITGYPDGTFGPNRQITRAEAVTLVNRTLNRHPDKDHLLHDMLRWPDNMDTNQWYYADMQEATNSHVYKHSGSHEEWTNLREARDWAAFEKAWSTENSAHNPGNVVKKGA